MTGSWWRSVLKLNDKKRVQICPLLLITFLQLYVTCSLLLSFSFLPLIHTFFVGFKCNLAQKSKTRCSCTNVHTFFSRFFLLLFFLIMLLEFHFGPITGVSCCICVAWESVCICALRLSSSDCTVRLLSRPQIKLPHYSRHTHHKTMDAQLPSNLVRYQL